MSLVLALAIVGQSCISQQVAYQPVQYQQTYNQSYVEKTIFVAVEAQDAPAYYAGLVGTAQRTAERQAQAQQTQASADARIDQLTRAILALQRRLDAQPTQAQRQQLLPDKPAPANAPQALPSEAVPPPPTISQASQRSSGQHVGLAVLTKNCAECHQGAAKKGGGIVLFAADGSWSVRDSQDLERVEAAIASRRMPKGPQKLTLRESANILKFLDEQASGLALNVPSPRGKVR